MEGGWEGGKEKKVERKEESSTQQQGAVHNRNQAGVSFVICFLLGNGTEQSLSQFTGAESRANPAASPPGQAGRQASILAGSRLCSEASSLVRNPGAFQSSCEIRQDHPQPG